MKTFIILVQISNLIYAPMESTNLDHQNVGDHSGSLIDSSVQMGSFGGVPDTHVWRQDFLLDNGSNDQNMQNLQNNFPPHLTEVLCTSRPLSQDELMNRPSDQSHLTKSEEISSGWELRSHLRSNFQGEDSINVSNNITAGKQQIPSLPNYSLQLMDYRLQNTCTISDIGSWSLSPSSFTHTGLDMPLLPHYHMANVKEEFIPMANYSTSGVPSRILQGFAVTEPYKSNESVYSTFLEPHGNKSMAKAQHLGPMIADHHDYNIAGHGFFPPIPSKHSPGVVTFGSSSCMSMPVLDFLASKPSDIRLQGAHSSSALNYSQDGKSKLHTGPQNRATLQGLGHEGPGTTSEPKRRSSTGHENTMDASFKRPRMESNSTLPAFKVRKEKLGDRITALQQLVSPFGKTDTASVLLEAIGYIKFLQEQVRVLSMPYLKTGCTSTTQGDQKGWGSSEQQESNESKQDLRSRGLCLVPVSCTLHVANDTIGADFWSPSLGGTYR